VKSVSLDECPSTSRYPGEGDLPARCGRDKATMQASEVPRAVAAAMSSASALDLTVGDAIVLHDSNRIVLRLLPCNLVARVAHIAHQAGAAFEVELAQRLVKTESCHCSPYNDPQPPPNLYQA
jgi:hypothetical protein